MKGRPVIEPLMILMMMGLMMHRFRLSMNLNTNANEEAISNVLEHSSAEALKSNGMNSQQV